MLRLVWATVARERLYLVLSWNALCLFVCLLVGWFVCSLVSILRSEICKFSSILISGTLTKRSLFFLPCMHFFYSNSVLRPLSSVGILHHLLDNSTVLCIFKAFGSANLSPVARLDAHCTNMYPMVFNCGLPWLPHVLESSAYPPLPNPILESQLAQSFSLLPRKPILALEEP